MSENQTPTRRRLSLDKNARLDISPERLAVILGCPHWDFMLIGDGSGTGGWSMAGGWACITIERDRGRRRDRVFGGWSRCSILVAELSAYLQALMTIEADHGDMLRRRLGRQLTFLVITDNQPIALQATRGLLGMGVGGDTDPIWAALRCLIEKTGSNLVFKFAPRLSTRLNVAVDHVAGNVRRALEADGLGDYRSRGSLVTLDSINPRSG